MELLTEVATADHPTYSPQAAAVLVQLYLEQPDPNAAAAYIDSALAAKELFASTTAVRYGARLSEVDRHDEALRYLAVAIERGDPKTREQAQLFKAFVLARLGSGSAAAEFMESSAAGDAAVSSLAREFVGGVMETLLAREAPGIATLDLPDDLRPALRRHYADLVSRQPPPNVGQLMYVVLTNLALEVEAAIKELGVALAARPWLATVATGDVNAHAWTDTAPDGTKTPIVAFDDGTYTFFHLIAKAHVRHHQVPALPIDHRTCRERAANHCHCGLHGRSGARVDAPPPAEFAVDRAHPGDSSPTGSPVRGHFRRYQSEGATDPWPSLKLARLASRATASGEARVGAHLLRRGLRYLDDFCIQQELLG